jgi:hypothetical protein
MRMPTQYSQASAEGPRRTQAQRINVCHIYNAFPKIRIDSIPDTIVHHNTRYQSVNQLIKV